MGRAFSQKCPIEVLNLDGSTIQLCHLDMMLFETPALTELHLSNCVGLVDEKKYVVSLICKLKNLKVLRFQRTTYLQPCEVLQINAACPELVKFTFSPVWKRVRNQTNQWVKIYETESSTKWGPDFNCMVRRIKYSYMSERFYSLYNNGPEWALTDTDSESELDTD